MASKYKSITMSEGGQSKLVKSSHLFASLLANLFTHWLAFWKQ